MRKLDILIVEDETAQREMLGEFLKKEGHRIQEARDGKGALDLIRERSYDLVLLDHRMPGMAGMDVLKEALKIQPEMAVIMITAFGTIEDAVKAMKIGAFDYITKPIDLDELLIILERVAEHQNLKRENELLRERLREKGVEVSHIVHKSKKMADLINLAARIAPSKATVLLQGESGTGKELFARLIHALSPRSQKPMVIVNCAALPESLLESELFGHEKGAFTGAIQRKIGLFEQADGGTLFLDEIGELPPHVQVKLLRFLQYGEFKRLGSNIILSSDVRLISATNRDLEAEVKTGAFREDLFYRINVITLSIPPLRERKEDIRPLVETFINRYSRENRKVIEGVTKEAMDLLLRYEYPGNVRELENIIERAVVIARGTFITRQDLPFQHGNQQHQGERVKNGEKGLLRESIESLECRLIKDALKQASSNQTKAAEILGISERMLRYKLKKYGLKCQ
jgi:two-component system NtrC family response regulator